MQDRQRRISFPVAKIYQQEDYVITPANQEIWSAICNEDEIWGTRPYEYALLLSGGKSSGKTHLAHIWQQICGAIFVNSIEQMKKLAQPACILDDAESYSDQDLFHIINYSNEEQIRLLLIFDAKPKRALADLQSRLNAIRHLNIKMPNEEMVKILLIKHCANRSLFVKPQVIDYIAYRIDKDYQKIQLFVEELDNLALDNSKEITINLARKLLG